PHTLSLHDALPIYAVDAEYARRTIGLEIALLVEHRVVRQLCLAIDLGDRAVANHGDGIVAHAVMHNAVAVIRDGAVAEVYRKAQLPNYTVFDEQRYFEPDGTPCVFSVDGVDRKSVV